MNRPAINFVEEKEVAKPKGFLELRREKRLSKKRQADDYSNVKEMDSTDVTGHEDISAMKARN